MQVSGDTVTENYAYSFDPKNEGTARIGFQTSFGSTQNQISTTKVTDGSGNVEYIIDPLEYTSYYTYDKLGRLVKEHLPFDTYMFNDELFYSDTLTYYDAGGRVIKEKQSNHMTTASEPTYTETTYTYDAMGRVLTTARKKSETQSVYTQYWYNAKGYLMRVYSGMEAPLELNASGQVTSADQDYHQMWYSYDAFGNLSSYSTGNVSCDYTYNPVTGWLLSASTASFKEIAYMYDRLGNCISVSGTDYNTAQPTSLFQMFEYNMAGQRTYAYDSQSGSETYYTYDALGNLITEQCDGAIKSYTYNNLQQVDSFTLKINGVVKQSRTYTYDDLGRLSELLQDATKINYTYDENGNLLTRLNTNVNNNATHLTTYTYTGGNKIKTVNVNNAAYSTVYQYYTNGNLYAETSYNTNDPDYSTFNTYHIYQYDLLNRLTVDRDAADDTYTYYTYDNYDNPTRIKTFSFNGTYKNVPFKEETRSYNSANQIQSRGIWQYDEDTSSVGNLNVISEVQETYYYDDYMNRTAKTAYVIEGPGGGVDYTDERYTYDALSRLSLYECDSNKGNKSTAYYYDADSVLTSIGGTNLYWNNDYVTYEQTGSAATSYVIGLGVEGVSGTNDTVYNIDGKGDVHKVGASAIDYDAYGRTEDTITESYGYRGYFLDKNSGMYLLGSRFYDAESMQFTQPDSYHWDNYAMNLFGYCAGDPINYTDPSGHWRISGNTATAQRGDTLWELAKQLTGSGANWTKLGYKGNQRSLQVGEKINIAPLRSGGGSVPQAPSTTKPGQSSKPKPPATSGNSGSSKPSTQKPTSPSSGGSSSSGNQQLTQKQKVTLTKESPIFWVADYYNLLNANRETTLYTIDALNKWYLKYTVTIGIGYNTNELGFITATSKSLTYTKNNVSVTTSKSGRFTLSGAVTSGGYTAKAYVVRSFTETAYGISIAFKSTAVSKLYGVFTMEMSYNPWVKIGATFALGVTISLGGLLVTTAPYAVSSALLPVLQQIGGALGNLFANNGGRVFV